MQRSDFYYDLPQELIAQAPLDRRDHSRLLVMDRATGKIAHRHFYEISDYLHAGDCLIVNDSRVLPSRLYGIKEGTGAQVEFLLLTHKGNGVWETLTGPGRRAKPGSRFTFGNGLLKAEVLEILKGGNRLVQFTCQGNFYEVLDQIGQMPLPHYIKEELQEKERYQTVYSREPGSAAAPTAGLHFTPELMQGLRERGVQIGFVILT